MTVNYLINKFMYSEIFKDLVLVDTDFKHLFAHNKVFCVNIKFKPFPFIGFSLQ